MSKYDTEYDEYDRESDDIYPATFHHQLKKDITIDSSNLAIESINTPTLHHKYLSMKKRAQGRLEKAETDFRQIVHGIMLYYEGRAPIDAYKARPLDITFSTKGEIERFVKSENAYIESEAIVNLWKRRVDFLTKVVEQINNRSYAIHNAVAYIKFTQGQD